jgi:hypothetical protein
LYLGKMRWACMAGILSAGGETVNLERVAVLTCLDSAFS